MNHLFGENTKTSFVALITQKGNDVVTKEKGKTRLVCKKGIRWINAQGIIAHAFRRERSQSIH